MKFAQGLGFLDAMTIGAEKPEHMDDALQLMHRWPAKPLVQPASRRRTKSSHNPGDHQKETCRLRHDRQAAATGRDHVAVAFFPEEIVACIDFATFIAVGTAAAQIGERARRVAPDGVVGRVDVAIAVEVAGPGASRQCVHRVLVEDRRGIAVEDPDPFLPV